MSVLALVGLVWALCLFALLVVASVVGMRSRRFLREVLGAPLAGVLHVVIPCRNESQRLPRTLHALLQDAAPGLRVWVVDDHSTDDTAALAKQIAERDHRVQVLHVAADAGGKAIALQTGIDAAHAADASSHVLCVDADVVLRPGALGGLLQMKHDSNADVLSGLPALELVTTWEQMLVPAFVAATAAHHPPQQVMNPASNAAFLNGQVMLMHPNVIARVGGFGAVATDVLEDVAMARLVKANGARIVLTDMRQVASTRMYTSLREILEGFGKNAKRLYGARGLCINIGLAAALLGPFVMAVVALVANDAAAMIICGTSMITTMMLQANIRRQVSWPTWPVLLLPVIYLVVAWVSLRALWQTHVTWRGRVWPVQASRDVTSNEATR
jgi:hypothetical protein